MPSWERSWIYEGAWIRPVTTRHTLARIEAVWIDPTLHLHGERNVLMVDALIHKQAGRDLDVPVEIRIPAQAGDLQEWKWAVPPSWQAGISLFAKPDNPWQLPTEEPLRITNVAGDTVYVEAVNPNIEGTRGPFKLLIWEGHEKWFGTIPSPRFIPSLPVSPLVTSSRFHRILEGE